MKRLSTKKFHFLSCSAVIFLICIFSNESRSQVSPYSLAPAGFKPSVGTSGGGVPQVNIVQPSAGGVSHNQYQGYNVGSSGLILNNSNSGGVSQIGGAVGANPNLQGTQASVILNEVKGAGASAINGTTEVFGGTADVIVANPNGVSVNGAKFINTNRVTLSTGTAAVNGGGQVELDVSRGTVNVGAGGLDGSNVGELNLLGKKVIVNGVVKSLSRLDILAGTRKYNHATRASTGIGTVGVGTGIDASALGAMESGQINLESSGKGVGVRAANNMAASAGGLTISADGQITLLGASRTANTEINVNSSTRIDHSGHSKAVGAVNLQASEEVTVKALSRVESNTQVNVTGNQVKIEPQGWLDSRGGIDVNSEGVNAKITQDGSINADGVVNISTTGAVEQSGFTQSGGALNVNADSVKLTNQFSRMESGGDFNANVRDFDSEGIVHSNATINFVGERYRSAQLTHAEANINIETSIETINEDAILGNVVTFSGSGVLRNINGGFLSGNSQSLRLLMRSFSNDGGNFYFEGDLDWNLPGFFDNGAGLFEVDGNLNLSTGKYIRNGIGTINVQGNQLTMTAGTDWTNEGRIMTNGAVAISAANSIYQKSGYLTAPGTLDLSSGLDLFVSGGWMQATDDFSVSVGRDFVQSGGQFTSHNNLLFNVARNSSISGGALRAGLDLLFNTGGDFSQSGGNLTATSNLNVDAGANASWTGGSVEAGDSLGLKAGQNLTFENTLGTAYNAVSLESGLNTEIKAGTVLTAGTNLSGKAGQDFKNSGGKIESIGDTSITAARDIIFNNGGLTQTMSSLNLSAGRDTKIADSAQALANVDINIKTQGDFELTNSAISPTMIWAGNDVNIISGGSGLIDNASALAANDVYIDAGLNFEAHNNSLLSSGGNLSIFSDEDILVSNGTDLTALNNVSLSALSDIDFAENSVLASGNQSILVAGEDIVFDDNSLATAANSMLLEGGGDIFLDNNSQWISGATLDILAGENIAIDNNSLASAPLLVNVQSGLDTKIDNASQLNSANILAVDAGQDFIVDNASEISAVANIQIRAGRDSFVQNDSKLKTEANLSLESGRNINFANGARATAFENLSLKAIAGDIRNTLSEIEAGGKLSASAGQSILEDSGHFYSQENMLLDAGLDILLNDGEFASMANIQASAGRDFTQNAGIITAGDFLDIRAGRNSSFLGGQVFATNMQSIAGQDTILDGADINVLEDIYWQAGNDTRISSSSAVANGDFSIFSGNDFSQDLGVLSSQGFLDIRAGNDAHWTDANVYAGTGSQVLAINDINQEDTSFEVQGDILLDAGKDIVQNNSDIISNANLTEIAGNDISQTGGNISSFGLTNLQAGGSFTQNTGNLLAGDIQIVAGGDISQDTGLFSSQSDIYLEAGQDIVQNSSDILADGDISGLVGRDLLQASSNIEALGSVLLDVGNDLSQSNSKLLANTGINAVTGGDFIQNTASMESLANISLEIGENLSQDNSNLLSGGNIAGIVGGTLSQNLANIEAEGSILLDVGDDIVQNDSAILSSSTINAFLEGSLFQNNSRIEGIGDVLVDAGEDITQNNGDIISNANLSIFADNNITQNGGNISSFGLTNLQAGGSFSQNTGNVLGGAIQLVAGVDISQDGGLFSSQSDIYLEAGQDILQSNGDILANGSITGIAGRNLSQSTANLEALGNILLDVGNNLTQINGNIISNANLLVDAGNDISQNGGNMSAIGLSDFQVGGSFRQNGGNIRAGLVQITAGADISQNTGIFTSQSDIFLEAGQDIVQNNGDILADGGITATALRNFFQSAGDMEALGSIALDVGNNFTQNNSSNILSNANISVTADGNFAQNFSDMEALGSIALDVANNFSQVNNSNILSNGNITVASGNFTQNGSDIGALGNISLDSAYDITQTNGNILSNANLTATALNDITLNSGNISSFGLTNLQAGRHIAQNNGNIYGGGIQIVAGQDIYKRGGLGSSLGTLFIQAGRNYEQTGGGTFEAGLDLIARANNNFHHYGGLLEAGRDMQLDSLGILGGNMVFSNSTTLAGRNLVGTSALNITGTGSYLGAGNDINLNSGADFSLVGASNFIAGGTMNVQSGGNQLIDNSFLQSVGNLNAISSGSFTVSNNATVRSNQNVSVAASLDINQFANLYGFGNVSLLAGGTANIGGLQTLAGGNLAVQANDIARHGGLAESLGISSFNAANSFTHNGGTSLSGAGSLVNAPNMNFDGGYFASFGDIFLQGTGGGTANIFNNNGAIIAGNRDIFVSANTVNQNSTLWANRNLVFSPVGVLNSSGTTGAAGVLSANASGNINITGGIFKGDQSLQLNSGGSINSAVNLSTFGDMVLNSVGGLNMPGAIYAGGDLQLNYTSGISTPGTIAAGGNLNLFVNGVLNNSFGSWISAGGDMFIDAAAIMNTQGGKISSGGTSFLRAGYIENSAAGAGTWTDSDGRHFVERPDGDALELWDEATVGPALGNDILPYRRNELLIGDYVRRDSVPGNRSTISAGGNLNLDTASGLNQASTFAAGGAINAAGTWESKGDFIDYSDKYLELRFRDTQANLNAWNWSQAKKDYAYDWADANLILFQPGQNGNNATRPASPWGPHSGISGTSEEHWFEDTQPIADVILNPAEWLNNGGLNLALGHALDIGTTQGAGGNILGTVNIAAANPYTAIGTTGITGLSGNKIAVLNPNVPNGVASPINALSVGASGGSTGLSLQTTLDPLVSIGTSLAPVPASNTAGVINTASTASGASLAPIVAVLPLTADAQPIFNLNLEIANAVQIPNSPTSPGKPNVLVIMPAIPERPAPAPAADPLTLSRFKPFNFDSPNNTNLPFKTVSLPDFNTNPNFQATSSFTPAPLALKSYEQINPNFRYQENFENFNRAELSSVILPQEDILDMNWRRDMLLESNFINAGNTGDLTGLSNLSGANLQTLQDKFNADKLVIEGSSVRKPSWLNENFTLSPDGEISFLTADDLALGSDGNLSNVGEFLPADERIDGATNEAEEDFFSSVPFNRIDEIDIKDTLKIDEDILERILSEKNLDKNLITGGIDGIAGVQEKINSRLSSGLQSAQAKKYILTQKSNLTPNPSLSSELKSPIALDLGMAVDSPGELAVPQADLAIGTRTEVPSDIDVFGGKGLLGYAGPFENLVADGFSYQGFYGAGSGLAGRVDANSKAFIKKHGKKGVAAYRAMIKAESKAFNTVRKYEEKMIAELMASGMSYEQAKKKAMNSDLNNIVPQGSNSHIKLANAQRQMRDIWKKQANQYKALRGGKFDDFAKFTGRSQFKINDDGLKWNKKANSYVKIPKKKSSWLGNILGAILAVAITIAFPPAGFWSAVLVGAGSGAAAGFTSTLVNTGDFGAALKAGAYGAITGAVSGGLLKGAGSLSKFGGVLGKVGNASNKVFQTLSNVSSKVMSGIRSIPAFGQTLARSAVAFGKGVVNNTVGALASKVVYGQGTGSGWFRNALKGASLAAAGAAAIYGIAHFPGLDGEDGLWNKGKALFTTKSGDKVTLQELTAKPLLQGAAQGGINEAFGGEFEDGFVAGATTSFAEPFIDHFTGQFSDPFSRENYMVQDLLSGIVGGTSSQLAGGTYGYGSMVGSNMFNNNALVNLNFLKNKADGIWGAEHLTKKAYDEVVAILSAKHNKTFAQIEAELPLETAAYLAAMREVGAEFVEDGIKGVLIQVGGKTVAKAVPVVGQGIMLYGLAKSSYDTYKMIKEIPELWGAFMSADPAERGRAEAIATAIATGGVLQGVAGYQGLKNVNWKAVFSKDSFKNLKSGLQTDFTTIKNTTNTLTNKINSKTPKGGIGNVTVYRGVHAKHPEHGNALKGKANPAGGHSDPVKHNAGDNISEFTSWTTDKKIAIDFSLQEGSGGVILKQNVPKKKLIKTPDVFKESEVLRKGKVEGAETIILSK